MRPVTGTFSKYNMRLDLADGCREPEAQLTAANSHCSCRRRQHTVTFNDQPWCWLTKHRQNDGNFSGINVPIFALLEVVLFKFPRPVCNFLPYRLTFPLLWASLWFTPTDFSSFCNYPHASRLCLAQFSWALTLCSLSLSVCRFSSQCACMRAFPDVLTFLKLYILPFFPHNNLF